MRIHTSSTAPEQQSFRRGASLLSASSTAIGRVMQASIALRLCVAGCLGIAISSLNTCAVDAAPMALAGTTVADPIADFIAEASSRYGVPVSWIRAVMRVESGGDAHAISAKGAMGLMQIMPDTWAYLHSRYHLGGDPFNPRDNILAGVAYLRELYDRYGSRGFLAAYNAGPERYEALVNTGQSLPDETRSYVAMVTEQIAGSAIERDDSPSFTAGIWSEQSLFTSPSDEHLLTIQTSAGLSHNVPTTQSDLQDEPLLGSQSAGLFVQTSDEKVRP